MNPPKNKRTVYPKVCYTCKYILFGEGFWACERERENTDDSGDGRQYFTTCDYHKALPQYLKEASCEK